MNAHTKDRALALLIGRAIEPMRGGMPNGARFDFSPAWVDLARTLRRAQLTLHRWAEEMCNGTIQRDGEQGDGKPFRVIDGMGYSHPIRSTYPVPDRELGALARVVKVCKDAGMYYFHQTDPRGCALYVAAEPMTDQNYSTKGIPCL